MTDLTPTLYTLAPSHFSERARWGLQWRGVPFTEQRMALGPHALFLKAKRLPHTTLPVLADGDALVQGSGAILDHIGLPAQMPEFDSRFEQVVGPLVRRFIYAAVFASEDPGIRDVLLEGVAPAQHLAGIAAWPAISAMMRRAITDPDHFATVSRDLAGQLDWFDTIVDAGGDGPLSGGFGRAHLTAASLLSPIAGSSPTPTRRRPNYGPAVLTQLAQWRDRPSLRWVRDTYRQHRIAPA